MDNDPHSYRLHPGSAPLLVSLPHDGTEHQLEVVEAGRHLLLRVRGRRRVTDQEDAHFGVRLPGQGAGQARAVVGALAAVGGIVEDQ